MRDKPSFDDLEARQISANPIDGLTDEEWAARNERQSRIIRRVCGVLVGLAVGSVLASRFGTSSAYHLLATWLVIIGSVLLFVGLFERSDL